MPNAVSRGEIRPPPTSQPADVWHKITQIKVTNCAALFIDIRGSSALSAMPGLESTTIAERTRRFLTITRALLKEGGQGDGTTIENPAIVKSLGDGLLCVWDFSSLEPKKHMQIKKVLLQAVLHLNERIGRRLAKAWGVQGPIETGMGLATGDAAKAQVGPSLDYFGYVVNLASKLQGFARPHGVVVAREFAEKWITGFPLEIRYFNLPMVGTIVKCYVTPGVNRDHQWTCLAWPGFARNNSNTPSGPPGLNTKGITVITHEGIHGKIGTLQIWPRNDPRDDEGDSFEIIIDDFDGLAIMSHEKSLDLTPRGRINVSKEVSSALRLPAEREEFLFVPIRCGLNAIAWNTKHDFSKIGRYAEILEQINGSFEVALYDNAGASLPVLLRCLPEQYFRTKSVFDAGKDEFVELNKLLQVHQRRYRDRIGNQEAKLFVLHPKIDQLAKELQYGDLVDVVLGGGAWLANPRRFPGKRELVASGIPKKDQGFLWVEGTALLRGAGTSEETKQIVEFLRDVLLDPEYQESLISAYPYGATPVNPDVLGRILSMQEEILNGRARLNKGRGRISQHVSVLHRLPEARPTLRETLTLFESNHRLKQNIVLRKKPSKLGEWLPAWTHIRQEYCREP